MPTCVQLLGKSAAVVRCDCLAMLSHAGHEQPPHGLGRRHGPILALFHDEEVRAASTLCELDISPMVKKTGKTASLKHRINGKQKRNTRPRTRKIVKQKKNTRPTDQMEAK